MKTAYYRHISQPGKIHTINADTISFEERRLIQTGNIQLFCPSCAERVIFHQASLDRKPGQKGYRGAHFNHQMKQNCVIEDCDLRVDDTADRSVYISQRLRTPLFLRPGPHGFTLAAGFSTANKDALHRLQTPRFKKLVIGNNTGTFAETTIDTLVNTNDDMVYVNLPDITKRDMGLTASISGQFGHTPISQVNPDWSDTMDWFTNRRGAIFQYSAGNCGEKIPSGNYIVAGRPYLIVDKNTTSNNSFILGTLKRLAKKYGFLCERKGNLAFSPTNHYDVHKIVLPHSSQLSPADYEDLFEYIRTNFAVILCNEVPETRPLWPPASRKSDAYAIQPTSSNTALIVASGVDTNANIQVHKDYVTTKLEPLTNCHDLTIGIVAMRTKRTILSIDKPFSGNVSSYRSETFKTPPTHGIYIDHEILLDKPETQDLPLPPNKKLTLSGSCPFTVYHNDVKIHVPTGAVQTITVKRNDKILLLTDTNLVFQLNIAPKSADIVDSENRTHRYERFKSHSRYKRF